MVLRLFDAGRRDLHLPRSWSQRLPFVAARYHLQILAAGGGSREDLGGSVAQVIAVLRGELRKCTLSFKGILGNNTVY